MEAAVCLTRVTVAVGNIYQAVNLKLFNVVTEYVMSVTKCFSDFFSRLTQVQTKPVYHWLLKIEFTLSTLRIQVFGFFRWLATLKSSDLPAKQQRSGKLRFRSFFSLTNLTLCALNFVVQHLIHCRNINRSSKHKIDQKIFSYLFRVREIREVDLMTSASRL
jgi:hypothetical protein